MNKLMISVVLLACAALASCQDCDTETSDPNSNPCTYTKCGWGATCRNVAGRAKCECPSACPMIYDPVCGSDGNTYSNSCLLNVYNCNNKASVTIEHWGRCEDS